MVWWAETLGRQDWRLGTVEMKTPKAAWQVASISGEPYTAMVWKPRAQTVQRLLIWTGAPARSGCLGWEYALHAAGSML